jgi:hypothetical protein
MSPEILMSSIYFINNIMSESEVESNIGHEVFNSYYKFCVERKPVDKCISQC